MMAMHKSSPWSANSFFRGHSNIVENVNGSFANFTCSLSRVENLVNTHTQQTPFYNGSEIWTALNLSIATRFSNTCYGVINYARRPRFHILVTNVLSPSFLDVLQRQVLVIFFYLTTKMCSIAQFVAGCSIFWICNIFPRFLVPIGRNIIPEKLEDWRRQFQLIYKINYIVVILLLFTYYGTGGDTGCTTTIQLLSHRPLRYSIRVVEGVGPVIRKNLKFFMTGINIRVQY